MIDHHHKNFMQRCFDLARLGEHDVQTNPMVGCVIVHQGKIIGEGYHKAFGESHAEVMALNSVQSGNKKLIVQSTMYVSLEPCSHFGKTPPCAHRIVKEGIRHVVVSCLDPNPVVKGSGIEYLKKNGVEVQIGILHEEGEYLIRKFKFWVQNRTPFVTLKWAQSADLKFGIEGQQVWLSNPFSKVFVHRLRATHGAIMVGTNTAMVDRPSLNTRLAPGPSPVRIVPDRTGKLHEDHPFFSDKLPTIIYSEVEKGILPAHIQRVNIDFSKDPLLQILQDLADRNLNTLLVEGGAQLIKSFIRENFWQEAVVIRTPKKLGSGISAPLLHGKQLKQFNLKDDEILLIRSDN